jgi:hypothetical protein
LHVPVLCSNATAMKDFDFFREAFFDPFDEKAFQVKLENTLSVPPDRQTLANISAVIRERYSWKTGADNLFQSIISHVEKQP